MKIESHRWYFIRRIIFISLVISLKNTIKPFREGEFFYKKKKQLSKAQKEKLLNFHGIESWIFDDQEIGVRINYK